MCRPIATLASVSGLEVRLEAAGERIVDDGDGRDLAQRRIDLLAGLEAHFVHEGQHALDVTRPLRATVLR